MAERTGFEPAVAFTTHAFQACTLDHSDTSPISASMLLSMRSITPLVPFCKKFLPVVPYLSFPSFEFKIPLFELTFSNVFLFTFQFEIDFPIQV